MNEAVLRYRYRAYPNTEARTALARTFGSCRVVFNDAISARECAYRSGLPTPTHGELSRKIITEAKRSPDREWLCEVSAVALQQALADAVVAYRNFFRSTKGAHKGRRTGRPKYRSRYDSRQSARFTSNARFKVSRLNQRMATLTLPKVGCIPFVLSRPLPSDPTSVTVVREADGRVYFSFVVRVREDTPSPTGAACGIDVGMSTFAQVVSVNCANGEMTEATIKNQRFLRRKARALGRSQRALSRRQLGSANRSKQKRRVAAQHRKVREARLDHAHKQARYIVATHDVVCVENLSVAAMARTLGKSVCDTGMSQFVQLLEAKARRQGKSFVKIDRSFPSTRMCWACKDLTGPKGRAGLGVRHWTCSTCGISHDRDTNAARNILDEGLRVLKTEQARVVAAGRTETENACGAYVSPPEMAAIGDEAGRASQGGAFVPA